MQFVDFALPLRVFRLPHKLFARDEYFHRSGRAPNFENTQLDPTQRLPLRSKWGWLSQDFERKDPSIALGRSSGERRRYFNMK